MNQSDMRKLPPQSIEAEMSILGGILVDNEAINRALEILTPEDLYRETHRKIMRAMIVATAEDADVSAAVQTELAAPKWAAR